MRDDLHRDVLAALKRYDFKERAGWLREGRCPDCGKKSLWTNEEHPWILRCDRINRCGYEGHVKELFPDIFENWSDRYASTDKEPNAAAEAYLSHARGLTLLGLRGAFTQETYVSRDSGESTATVRFPIPGGSWWERFIDRPSRFGRQKARFQPGGSYAGEAWVHPADDDEVMAKAGEIWLAEGVFDSLSLREHDVAAAATLSTSNYPEAFLGRVALKCLDLGQPRPSLVFAFDSDRAGREAIRKFVERARADGWEAGAAQIPGSGKSKVDWNDLHLRKKLEPQDLEHYLWLGELLLAPSPSAKALLLYQKAERPTFPFDYDNRLWWGNVDPAQLAQAKEALGKSMASADSAEIHETAVRQTLKVSSIANCHPKPLYFQIDRLTDESWYFYRVDFPHGGATVKNVFTPSQISKAQGFKERLLAVAPFATFTGNTAQLDRLHDLQRRQLRTVEALGFVGYCREHGAYVFNDVAVKDGKVIAINEDDYFDLGEVSLKSIDRSVDLSITPWAAGGRWEWLDDLYTAFGPKGLVALTFWFGSFFAEQIRAQQKSYPFLEITGDADTGKTTIIEFLWKLCGRQGYEGFDPSKATASGRARNFAQVGNMPVVLMEGDREEETARSRKFDFNELKSLYNGRSSRSRGVRTSGNETYEPPFRGAIVIEQNHPIETSDDAIPTRLVHLRFDGDGYSPTTKAAAQRLEGLEVGDVSGFILAAACREREVLAKIAELFPAEERALLENPRVGNRRIAKCHAQMVALLEALALVAPLKEQWINTTRGYIATLAAERKAAIAADHPVIETFWEAFDWIGARRGDSQYDRHPLNHHRAEGLIAVSLNEFAAACAEIKIPCPDLDDLKRHLRMSKVRRFHSVGAVNSALRSKAVHCWVFEDKP